MSPESSVNRRTRPLWTAVLAGLPLLAPLAGCIVVDDTDDGVYYDDPPYVAPEGVEVVPIDEGATLQQDPGEGVGVFVEYLGGGQWNVWATCDTEFSGFSCNFDLFVSAEGVAMTDDIDLEDKDFVDESLDSIHANFDTDFDVDGISFATFEGDAIQLEVWLDGEPDASLVFWTANGTIFEGLPTNPALFQP